MIGMLRLGAQRAAQRQAVLAGQHQVEQDEVDAAVGQHLAHGTPVGRRADAKALLGQRARDEIAQSRGGRRRSRMCGALCMPENIGEPRRKRLSEMCVEVLPGRRLTNFVTKNPAPEKLECKSPLSNGSATDLSVGREIGDGHEEESSGDQRGRRSPPFLPADGQWRSRSATDRWALARPSCVAKGLMGWGPA